MDKVIYDGVYILPICPAGNSRFLGPTNQPITHDVIGPTGRFSSDLYHDLNGASHGFDTIPGIGLAKNCLTVGNVNDIPNGYAGPSSVVLASSSGCGPTDDGRIKPDIVGNGQHLFTTAITSDSAYQSYDGTSFAVPNVGGSLNLLVELHGQLHGTNYPMWSSTLKGVALHNADEAGAAAGPDYVFGWGLLNTRKAAELMRTNAISGGMPHMKEVVLLNGDFIEFGITNAGGTSNPLRVTIAWTDPPGQSQPNALDPTNLVLVNDLDLRVIGPGPSGPTNFPWVLNPNSPTSAATKADNFRDNVEQVHIASPTAGWYRVKVTHKGTLTNGYQNVSIILSGNRPQPPPELKITDFFVDALGHQWIEWPSVVGQLYRIESTDNMIAPVWSNHLAAVSATKTNMIFGALTLSESGQRYFRIRSLK
jgi:hypothetical protein